MTNIEKALHWAETLIQQTDEHLPCCSEALKIELIEQREFAVTAIAALQEKLARENGCEHCTNTSRLPELADPHEFCVKDDAIYSYDSVFGWEGTKISVCPWCGRKLGGGGRD